MDRARKCKVGERGNKSVLWQNLWILRCYLFCVDTFFEIQFMHTCGLSTNVLTNMFKSFFGKNEYACLQMALNPLMSMSFMQDGLSLCISVVPNYLVPLTCISFLHSQGKLRSNELSWYRWFIWVSHTKTTIATAKPPCKIKIFTVSIVRGSLATTKINVECMEDHHKADYCAVRCETQGRKAVLWAVCWEAEIWKPSWDLCYALSEVGTLSSSFDFWSPNAKVSPWQWKWGREGVMSIQAVVSCQVIPRVKFLNVIA